MNELFFTGMDILEEIKNMINFTTITCTNGMTDGELSAYRLGIKNTLSALQSVLDCNDTPVVNIEGIEIPTELSVDELEEFFSEH